LLKPRRVAATTVAARVAEEMRCEVGHEVGYSIRFEDLTSAKTRIKFLTDGMLLREALVDPLLSRYSVIMVDEAHERSLSSDVLLGLLKKIRKRRPELRIIVSSATLEAQLFASFFAEDGKSDQCKIISLEGRAHPVEIFYLEEPAPDYVDKAIQTAFQIHTQEPPGDILIFLTGRSEIDRAMQSLSDLASTLPRQTVTLQPLPLYAGLPTDQQMYVFEPPALNTRKVILATNIAEASVTIDGIVYIIDPGFVKLRAFNPTTNIDTLTVAPTSRASATQRAGRAGRTRPGKCYRLYPASSFPLLSSITPPEIQRSNLAPLVLQLKALGIDNIVRFDFLTSPPAALLSRAFELLFALGAIDDYAKLTNPLGSRIAELPLPPSMAVALLKSPEYACVSELLSIAAITSAQGSSSIWFSHSDAEKAMEHSRRKFAAEEGDHLTLLNVYQAFVTKGKKQASWCHQNHLNAKTMARAVSIRSQLARYLQKMGILVPDSSTNSSLPAIISTSDKSVQILKSLTSGLFPSAARMQPDGSFRSVSGGVVLYAHPSSLMFNRRAEWVVFGEVVEMRGKRYVREVSRVEKGWLVEGGRGYYTLG
jgi:ATP-dependent RNA helicase DDX35